MSALSLVATLRAAVALPGLATTQAEISALATSHGARPGALALGWEACSLSDRAAVELALVMAFSAARTPTEQERVLGVALLFVSPRLSWGVAWCGDLGALLLAVWSGLGRGCPPSAAIYWRALRVRRKEAQRGTVTARHAEESATVEAPALVRAKREEKSRDESLSLRRAVAALSPKERELAGLIAAGCTVAEISSALRVSTKIARTKIARLLSALRESL
jgi:DNA-binding CsgD family transcriptional regulator